MFLDMFDDELDLVYVFPGFEISTQDSEVVHSEILKNVFCVLLLRVSAAQDDVKITGLFAASLQAFLTEEVVFKELEKYRPHIQPEPLAVYEDPKSPVVVINAGRQGSVPQCCGVEPLVNILRGPEQPWQGKLPESAADFIHKPGPQTGVPKMQGKSDVSILGGTQIESDIAEGSRSFIKAGCTKNPEKTMLKSSAFQALWLCFRYRMPMLRSIAFG
jgi:hypothetical protein